MSPAAARRFARRNLRRLSPTPDLVTSLVRPPSPENFYIAPQVHNRMRQNGRAGTRRPLSQTPGRRNHDSSVRCAGPLLPPHPSSLDIPPRYGGNGIFDMYSLTYVSEVDPNLLCPICHDALVDPVTTPCDHTFCYRCIRRSIASSPSGTACPIDREDLSWPDCFSAARLVRLQLNNLLVKCPNRSRGCKKEFCREVVERHATNDCRFGDFRCPDVRCDKRLRHKPIEDTCQHFEIRCSYCEDDIIAADRDVHLASCIKAKTRCEACWQMVTKCLMPSHLEVDCDGVEVGCTYEELGCPVRVTRGEVTEHMAECPFHPDTASGMVIRSQRDLLQSYTDLGEQVQNLQSRQEATNKALEEIVTGRRSGDSNDSLLGDNRTIQDLDAGFEEVHQNLTHLEARQSMWTLNQVMPIREEVTELRNNINMIRMHVNWLLNRSREEGRNRAANNTGASTMRRDDSSDPAVILPERRRSSGADTDLPRL
mgnify:CR=1 FL=1